MIEKNNKEISAVYFNNKVIAAIYKGTRLVWQAIHSCFGSGRWLELKPWDNREIWKS